MKKVALAVLSLGLVVGIASCKFSADYIGSEKFAPASVLDNGTAEDTTGEPTEGEPTEEEKPVPVPTPVDDAILIIEMDEIKSATGSDIITAAAIKQCYPQYDISKVQAVSIQSGATAIAPHTFGEEWVSLKNVVFPDTLQVIDDAAFYGCPALHTLIIPQSVQRIGAGAFKDCASLEIVSFADRNGWIVCQSFGGGYYNLEFVLVPSDFANPMKVAKYLVGNWSNCVLKKR